MPKGNSDIPGGGWRRVIWLYENRGWTKLTVVVIIVFSLLPVYDPIKKALLRSTGVNLDLVLFLLFALEILLIALPKLICLFRDRCPDQEQGNGVSFGRRLFVELALLLVDLCAAASFLSDFVAWDINYLRLLRLIRLIKLSRFLRPMLKDLQVIVTRRGIKRQLLFILIVILLLSTFGGIVYYYIELVAKRSAVAPDFFQSLWWSFIHVQDPGNMAGDNRSLEVALLGVVLTMLGVFVLSFIIGLGQEVIQELLELNRKSRYRGKAHYIIFGWRPTIVPFIRKILSVLRDNGFSRRKVVIVQCRSKDYVNDVEIAFRNRNVYCYHYESGDEIEALHRANIEQAGVVLALPDDENEYNNDAEVTRKIIIARKMNPSLRIIALLDDPFNLYSAKQAGSTLLARNPECGLHYIDLVINASFLGGYICQNLFFREINHIYQELLTHEGSEIYYLEFSDYSGDPALARLSGKRVSFHSLYLRMLEEEVLVIGLLRQPPQRGQSSFLHPEKRVILNPLDFLRDNKNQCVEYVSFPDQNRNSASGDAGLIALAPNHLVLKKAFSTVLPDLAHLPNRKPARRVFQEQADEQEQQVRGDSRARYLIFGWNYSVPKIIEEIYLYYQEKYGSFSLTVTIYLNRLYGYNEVGCAAILKRIRESFPLDAVAGLGVNVCVGQYNSRIDLFGLESHDEDRVTLADADYVLILPDLMIKDKPDADVFLLTLYIFDTYTYREGNHSQEREMRPDIRIFSVVSETQTGKDFEEKLIYNLKLSGGRGGQGSSGVFNFIYAEDVLENYISMNLVNKYSRVIYNKLLSSKDGILISLADPLFVRELLQREGVLSTDQTHASFAAVADFFLSRKLLLLGYCYARSESCDDNGAVINPSGPEEKMIDFTRAPSPILLGCNTNPLLCRGSCREGGQD